MDGINYVAADIKGKNQAGSTTKTDNSKEINYQDGLSKEELKKIDKNNDGVITESEFKKAFNGGKNYEQYWAAYKDFYKATTKELEDGKKQITQTIGNKTVKSIINKNGKMTAYTETVTNDDGSTTTVRYEMKNGKPQKVKTTTKPAKGQTGTTTVENQKTGTTKQTTPDKSTATINTNKDVIKVHLENNSDEDKSSDYNINYYDNGILKSVKINETTYKGDQLTTKGNTITVKDDNNKTVGKIKKLDNGKTVIVEYNDKGKKAKRSIINEDGSVNKVEYYNGKGQLTKKQNAQTGNITTYKYDTDGNLKSAVEKTSDNKKVNKKTYMTQDKSSIYKDATGKLVESQTIYDEEGKVKEYRTYSYEKSGNNVKKTVKVYTDESKTTEIKTNVFTQDAYGNNLKRVTKNADGSTSTTTYKYNQETGKKALSINDLTETVTEKGNKTITDKYENGKITNRSIQTVKDGKSTTIEKEYEYNKDGTKASEKKIYPDGSYIITEYLENGESKKSYYDTLGRKTKEVTLDANGNVIKTTEFPVASNDPTADDPEKNDGSNPGNGTQAPSNGNTQAPSNGNTQAPSTGNTQTPSTGNTQTPSVSTTPQDGVNSPDETKPEDGTKKPEDYFSPEVKTVLDSLLQPNSNEDINSLFDQYKSLTADLSQEEKAENLQQFKNYMVESYTKKIDDYSAQYSNSMPENEKEALVNDKNIAISNFSTIYNKINLEEFLNSSELPQENKTQYYNLLNNLSSAKNEEEYNQGLESLNSYNKQLTDSGVLKDEKLINECLYMQESASDIYSSNKLNELYTQLKEANSDKAKATIQNQINQTINFSKYNRNKIEISRFMYTSKIPSDQKENLASLYSKLLESKSFEETTNIEKELNDLYEEYELSDDEMANCYILNMNSYNLSIDNIVTDLNGELLESTLNEDSKNYINDQIKTIQTDAHRRNIDRIYDFYSYVIDTEGTLDKELEILNGNLGYTAKYSTEYEYIKDQISDVELQSQFWE